VFYTRYREDGWGRAAFHPKMLVKVLVYGCCMGITSSRKLARGLQDDVALRFLAANQQPGFRTISDFRKDHLEALDGLFVEVLAMCQEAGLAKMGRVALDGRKVAGNTSLEANRTLEGIKSEVAKLLAEAEVIDAQEDEKYGKDCRGDELPEGLRTKQGRLVRLKEAQARLEQEEQDTKQAQTDKLDQRAKEEAESGQKKRGPKPKSPDELADGTAKANITDPESRILKTRRGYVQGFNGQAMADCSSQVIVAQGVTQEENDRRQLAPMLQICENQAGRLPKEVLCDAGYWSAANAGLETEAALLIATQKDWKTRKRLAETEAPRGRIPKGSTTKELMERKLLTKRGKAAYKQRGSTIEPVFGQMVMRGLTRFMLKGTQKVGMEWSLWCTTHNLLKLWRAGWWPETA